MSRFVVSSLVLASFAGCAPQAFITRGTTTYVAGITSYGDSACTVYGVSTRVDGFASWINARTGL